MKVAEPEAKVMSAEAEVTEDEPADEPLSTPEIITSQEVTEANETPDAFSAPVTEESAVTEEVTQATEETKVEEVVEEKIQQTEAEQIIQEVEDVLEGGDEDEEESEDEIVATQQVGDAPAIEKVSYGVGNIYIRFGNIWIGFELHLKKIWVASESGLSKIRIRVWLGFPRAEGAFS